MSLGESGLVGGFPGVVGPCGPCRGSRHADLGLSGPTLPRSGERSVFDAVGWVLLWVSLREPREVSDRSEASLKSQRRGVPSRGAARALPGGPAVGDQWSVPAVSRDVAVLLVSGSSVSKMI